MRHLRVSRPLIAGALVLAMALSVTGLLGAAGTSIRIASPRAGATVKEIITIQASVRTDEDVTYVILGMDENRPQSSNHPPFSFQFDTRELSDGPHRVFVEAYDRYGLVGSSAVTTIYVKNGSSSWMRAEAEPKIQVAAKPAASASVAVAPATQREESAKQTIRVSASPPARTAAPASTDIKNVTVPTPMRGGSSVSPMVAGRGPLPAPTHTAAETALATGLTDVVSAPGYTRIASGPIAGSAPALQAPARPVRGHTVVVNGQLLEFDVTPEIVDGRMRVPFRALFESHGSVVSWQAKSRTAVAVKGETTVEVPIGREVANVNGRSMDMGGTATIREDRTIIPVRFFAAAVGAAVHWDSVTRTAMIQTPDRMIAERSPND